MSYAGHVLSMILSLKNNSRKRKSIFDKKHIPAKTTDKWKMVVEQKANPKDLEEIRIKLQIENKKINQRKIALLIFIILIIFSLAMYFLT